MRGKSWLAPGLMVAVGFLARYGVIMVVPIVLLFTFIGYPFAGFILG